MSLQYDQHRRDQDARMTARIIERNKQAKRNAREWARRAADACRKQNFTLARNLIVQAESELASVG